MEWWQVVLILLVSVAGGILVGVLLSYLIRLSTRKQVIKKLFSQKLSVSKLSIRKLFSQKLSLSKLSVPKKLSISKREPVSAAGESSKLVAPDLFAEIENNHRISTEPDSNKLVSFQTQAWDAHQFEVGGLPADLREDLDQAYIDMRLANSLVWVSTELGRRSQSLDENYMKLRATIAERLHRIKPLIDQLQKK